MHLSLSLTAQGFAPWAFPWALGSLGSRALARLGLSLRSWALQALEALEALQALEALEALEALRP